MQLSLQKVVADALQLSAEDRAVLARTLIKSLESSPEVQSDNLPDLSEEEIERRVDDVLSGKPCSRPAEGVIEDLRHRYG